MSLFEMQYVDKNGNLTDIDGNGTHEFKHRIIAVVLLAIILPTMLTLASICHLVKALVK